MPVTSTTEPVFRPATLGDPQHHLNDLSAEIAETTAELMFAARYPIRNPTVESPLRVYVGGDSLSDAPRLGLQRSDASVSVEAGTKISTGIVADWYFDWVRHLRERVAPAGHDVVVLTFGGNDAQPLGGDAPPGTDLWRERYAARVDEIASDFAGVAQVVWIGLPPVTPDNIQVILPDVNAIVAAAAERWPHVHYLDAVALFGDDEGGFVLSLPDPDTERLTQVRAPDGVHYTPAAGEWMADEILHIIESLMSDPAALWPATG